MSPDVRVVVGEAAPRLAASLQSRIDATWELAGARRPQLFDGELFDCERVDEGDSGVVVEVVGRFVPYSWYVAARMDPAIASELGLRAMGVSGLVLCPDGVVVGRRAAATNDPGLLELVPSGAVDPGSADNGRVDLRAALLTELREELGVGENDLTEGPTPFAFVEDDATLVGEMGLRMKTPLLLDAICAAHARLQHPEHDEVIALAPAAIAGEEFVATSVALTRAAALD